MMHLSRRRLLSGSALVISSALLAACGTTPTPQVIEKEVTREVPAAAAGGVTPVNISFYADDLAQQAVWEGIFSAFMEDNPDIILRPQQVLGEDYFQKLQVLMAGGVAPEVMEMESKQVPGFAVRNSLLDLQPYVDTSDIINQDDFIAYQWNKHTHGGSLFGLPFSVSTVVLYYNEAVFENAGVDLPPTAWDDENWQFENFLSTAQALTSGSGTDKVFGFMQTRWWPYMFPWIWSNGGAVLNEERTHCLLGEELSQGALQFLSDLINDYAVWPTPDQATEGMDTMFGTDRIGMTPRTVQNSSIMNATEGLRWNVAPMPKGKGETALTRAPSDCYCVWNQAPNKDAAWKVAEWITGPKGAQMLLNGGYLMPARKGVATPESLRQALGENVNVDVMIDGTENHTGHQPVTVKWAEMGDLLAPGYEAVLAGDMTPAEYAADTCPKIDELLSSIPSDQLGWLGD